MTENTTKNAYAQHLYEVRYPDGDTVQVRAHHIVRDECSVNLRTQPNNKAGTTVFTASHQAGVTIRLVQEDETSS